MYLTFRFDLLEKSCDDHSRSHCTQADIPEGRKVYKRNPHFLFVSVYVDFSYRMQPSQTCTTNAMTSGAGVTPTGAMQSGASLTLKLISLGYVFFEPWYVAHPFCPCLYHFDVRYRLQNLCQRMIDTTDGSGVTRGGASTEKNGTNRGGSMTMTGGNGDMMAGGYRGL